MSSQDFEKPIIPAPHIPDQLSDFRKIPTHIGPYKIESLLEKGGMSILYLGTHPDTKEPTTVKVLSPKYVSHPDIVQRFLNEAEIIAMADHPNIVKLYGHGEWEGGLYIAMEFIQGISLRQYILQTPMSLRKALEMVIDIAYAICHLHTHGVIHRDLKPENILVSDTGVLKVIDFGIAQLLTDTLVEGSKSKLSLIGTPIYMSPEQRDNPESVGYPSDIYSLGIIAYELIQGKLSLGQIHLSLVPKGLQKILAKALQPKPADRYQDVVDFITDISSYLHSNAVEKEKLAGDHLSELSENLKEAYKALRPPPPLWPETECAIVIHKLGNLSGGYYDFFTFHDGTLALIAGEAIAEGVKGILYTAVMRGMTKGIQATKVVTPGSFIADLQQMITLDHMDSLFTFSLLVLNPHTNKMSYLSCGHGELLVFDNENKSVEILAPGHPAIGIEHMSEFRFETRDWNIGDTIVLISHRQDVDVPFIAPNFLSEDWWLQPFQDSGHTPMQRQLENAYRRAKVQNVDLFRQRAVNMIGIRRN
ncbi:MAG: protein kinase [Parachlamydiales bacterium]|jgi:hypothetical protein